MAVLQVTRRRLTADSPAVAARLTRYARSDAQGDIGRRGAVRPRMTFREELSGFVLTVPYAPRQMEIAGQGATYETVPRPGRTPLIVWSGLEAEERAFDLFLVDRRNPGRSIQELIAGLRRLSRSRERLIVKYGGSTALWRMRQMTMRVEERTDLADLISRATASVTLVRSSDWVLNVGPVTGGAKPPAAPAAPPPGAPAPARPAAPRTHVVSRGETLSGIALRFYRDASQWRRIADTNKIRNPNLIRVGQRLVIP